MEKITIPGWFLYLVSGFITLVIPWGVWVTRMMFDNDKAISLNTSNDQNVNSELKKIHDVISEGDHRIESRFEKFELKFDKMEGKFDALMAQEINFLKQLVIK